MSVFDLKGNSGSNNWNYTDNTKQNYSTMLMGTVVEISNPQSINYGTKKPEFWPDGNPKRNLRLTVMDAAGVEFNWTFAPRSAAATACLNALDPQGNRERVSIEEMLGKMVVIQTRDGVYNQAHPRPWSVQVQGDGNVAAVRGLKDLSQQAQAPNPMAQNMVPAQPNTSNPALNNAMANLGQAMGVPVQNPAQPAANPMAAYQDLYAEDIPF